MKKLLALSFLFLESLTSNAQDTIFNSNRQVRYINEPEIKLPAAKWAIFLDPLAAIGAGMALGADFFVDNLQFRVLGAYHTAAKPWFYDAQGFDRFGYQSFDLKDFWGYRLEFQARKDLTEDKTDNTRLGAGLFANFRSVTINGKQAYIFNTNSQNSRLVLNPTLSGQAVTFGPIFTFSEHRKLWYFDAHIGPGMVIDVGGGQNEFVGLDLVNPYKAGVMLKFGAVIGLNMK